MVPSLSRSSCLIPSLSQGATVFCLSHDLAALPVLCSDPSAYSLHHNHSVDVKHKLDHVRSRPYSGLPSYPQRNAPEAPGAWKPPLLPGSFSLRYWHVLLFQGSSAFHLLWNQLCSFSAAVPLCVLSVSCLDHTKGASHDSSEE